MIDLRFKRLSRFNTLISLLYIYKTNITAQYGPKAKRMKPRFSAAHARGANTTIERIMYRLHYLSKWPPKL